MTTDKEIVFKHLQKQYNCLIKTIKELGYISREQEIEMIGDLEEKKLQYDLDKPYSEKGIEIK